MERHEYTFDQEIHVGTKTISHSSPCFIVAEIGLNHNGDITLARRLIEEAAAAGADAVKFQKRDNKTLFTRAAYDSPYTAHYAYGNTYGEHREALELDEKQYGELKGHAESLGLIFFASVWDIPSADIMERLGSQMYKLASADVTNIPLLRHVAKLGKPIILSTGMSTPQEVQDAVDTVHQHNKKLLVLQCTSTYPADFEDIDLRVMDSYRARFGCIVGYSGHEKGIAVSSAAVALGAKFIERHLTLDRTLKGPDHAASLEPQGFQKLCRDIRAIEKALGSNEKRLNDKELPARKRLAKSVVAAQAISKGQIITRNMLAIKCPGTGLTPKYYDSLPGALAKQDIPADTVITQEMVEWPSTDS